MNLLTALIISVVLNGIFIVEKLVRFTRRKFNEAVEAEAKRITSSRNKPTKKQMRENQAPETSPRQFSQQPYHIPRTRSGV